MDAQLPALHQGNQAIGHALRHAMAMNVPDAAAVPEKARARLFVPGAPDTRDVRPGRIHDPLPGNAAQTRRRCLIAQDPQQAKR